MISGSYFPPAKEHIWNLSNGHIGVLTSILRELHDQLKSKPGERTATGIINRLHSSQLINTIFHKRGFPRLISLERTVEVLKLPKDTYQKAIEILNLVAKGKKVALEDTDHTPGKKLAVNELWKEGYLLTDELNNLCFASNLHLSCWIDSYTRDDMSSLLSPNMLIPFVLESVGRMSYSSLVAIQSENNATIRERQIHMELVFAMTSILPKTIKCVTEWKTLNKRGYVDMCIPNDFGKWFVELLVDGDRAVDHERRFQQGGKYNSSLLPGSEYVLVDFRLSVAARKRRKNFIYVKFRSDYTHAMVEYYDLDVLKKKEIKLRA
jgi:hypothetical protein